MSESIYQSNLEIEAVIFLTRRKMTWSNHQVLRLFAFFISLLVSQLTETDFGVEVFGIFYVFFQMTVLSQFQGRLYTSKQSIYLQETPVKTPV